MTAADPDRASLEAAWLTLTRETLPGLAGCRMWPVRADHCFQRILLDAAVGGVWYDAVAARPAYRHIAVDRLAEALRLGEGAAAGTVDLATLNRQSLAWRRARQR
ncbi:GCN5-related N-acetyltransferase [Sphingomonas kyungheensis]|uniref:GCN5-related N-acetyltransferase n=1 Tax=Sphingomonas kyungheensis TaxID=1069987 RepID=A0ABU8H2E2_9SPHN